MKYTAQFLHTDSESEEMLVNLKKLRLDALKAREELVIHRQALGFTWNNKRIVENQFPIEQIKRDNH